ncbi:MAG TPA: cation diffusion facilitator family transporter [Solirubrobacteraceae bacterium]|nr:cation diffusion facilitator family transporter [Solirubrobacteraceae bacterium]
MAHDHAHPVPVNSDQRWLGVALAITGVLVALEVVAGLLTGSIALLSDAAHNVTDAASIALALLAARLALRPPSGGLTFGLRRMEILSAQVNGATLLVLAGVIAFESVGRLLDPPDIDAAPVILVGVLGGAANAAAAWALSRATRQSLNVRGAAQHVLADLYGSVAAVVAGVAVLSFGFLAADPLAALVVVGLMGHAGWGLLRDSGRILLEAAPEGMDVDAVGRSMSDVPGVVEIHDLHVWEITSGFPALAAHVLVAPGEDCHAARRTLETVLHDRFELQHTTLQVDHAPRHGDLLDIAPLRPR